MTAATSRLRADASARSVIAAAVVIVVVVLAAAAALGAAAGTRRRGRRLRVVDVSGRAQEAEHLGLAGRQVLDLLLHAEPHGPLLLPAVVRKQLRQLRSEAAEVARKTEQHFAEVHHLLMGGGGLAAGPGAALAAARAAAAPASAPAPPLHPAPVHRDVDVRHREPKADHGAGSGCEDRAAAAALLAPFRTLPGTDSATLPNLPNAHGDRGTQS